MTSKEALKSLCNHCEKLSIRDGFIGCPYRCISNDYCEEFETIKKDLEVLEILKDNLFEEKGSGRFKGINVISCSLGNEHSGRDYYKVKERLEHE